MAQARKPFDWNDPKNLKSRAWESVKEFFGKDEPAHALSPDLVAKESTGDYMEAKPGEGTDPNSERLYRETERRAINASPSTTWPG